MSMINSAMDIAQWLRNSIDDTDYGKFVRERLKVSNNSWYKVYRSDCNIETAYAFILAWKHSGEYSYLNSARELYEGVKALQQENGSVWRRTDSDVCYISGCSKVAVNLFRMADIDYEYASEYRATAVKVTDWLLTIQNSDGGFPRSTAHASYTACFTAHAVSAFAMAYRYTNTNRAAYLEAIKKAVNFIISKIRDDNMITLMGASEAQRPPSSDQGIVIRGLAHAELYLPNSEFTASCRNARARLLSWFMPLLTEEGAVRNGYGTGANGADTINVTDYVYTMNFAIEALYLSACVDGDIDYLDAAMRVIRFAQGNVYYSSETNINGALRGAFNIAQRNWDTSEATLDTGEQGGGDMIYTGWTNAPIAAHMFNFSDLILKKAVLSICSGNKVERIAAKNGGTFNMMVDGNCVHFPLVKEVTTSATPVKVYVGGMKKTLSYLV